MVADTAAWHRYILDVVAEFRGLGLSFAIANILEHKSEIESYGREVYADEFVVMAMDHKGLKYMMQSDFTDDNLRAFIQV